MMSYAKMIQEWQSHKSPETDVVVSVVGFPHAVRLTGSLGAISNRGLLTLLQREPTPERPHNVPGFYANAAVMHAS